MPGFVLRGLFLPLPCPMVELAIVGNMSEAWAWAGRALLLLDCEVICWMFVASRFVLEDLGAKRF